MDLPARRPGRREQPAFRATRPAGGRHPTVVDLPATRTAGFVVVEYDADRGNPWVPHPFAAATWSKAGRAPRPGAADASSAACRAGSSGRSTRPQRAAGRAPGGQPLEVGVGRFVVALGGDRTRSRASSSGAGAGTGQIRSGPRSASSSRRPCPRRGRVVAGQAREGQRPPSSRASRPARAASTPSAAASTVAARERERVVRRHDGRPATAVGRRRAPSSRSPRGAPGTRTGRRCRSSRTRGGTATGRRASAFAPCETTSGWIRSRRSART